MAKARKILSNTISELLKETSLETRVKLSCWFMINNIIHKFKSNKEYKWIHISDIDKFGLPKPIKSIMDRL
mgnify:CR=1 FL=1